MDTYTNLVVYRGHESPVWDVKWNPTGLYFGTASRDRTARLWSTDRASCLRIYAGHLSDVDVGCFRAERTTTHGVLVSSISSQLALSCHRVLRLDSQTMGCTAG